MGYNLTQINPAYELVKDVVVGTATTSVDFTGLNITKDDDYMLVSDILNPQASDTYLYLLANANYTNSNYYAQRIIADSTTIAGDRPNEPRQGYVNAGARILIIQNIKLTNNGYFVAQSKTTRQYNSASIKIENFYMTSTFTATSITSLRVATSLASAIGAGSRFQLYKRVAPIVFDYTVSTARTSVDITGLSIDKGSEYQLVVDLVGATASTVYWLYANGNTTTTNYYRQFLYASSNTIGANRSNDPMFFYNTSINQKNFMIANIKLTNNGYVISQNNAIENYGGSSIVLNSIYETSTFTATSITQLTITASVANGIGVGSRFQLIKLR